MTRVWTIAAILFTLLLLMSSAFMPPLAFFILDHQLENEMMQKENADVSLVLSQNLDFFRALDLFRNQQSQIELTEGYRMTEEDVSASAHAMILFFGNVYSAPEVTPVLITSQESIGLSGVYWRCVWRDTAGGQEILWLDVQSGQMVGFQGRVMVSSRAVDDEAKGNYLVIYEELLSVMVDFCRAYYPVDDVDLTDQSLATFTQSDDPVLDNKEIILTRKQDDLVETYRISVRLRGDLLYFNL